jgi:hypothetical protein
MKKFAVLMVAVLAIFSVYTVASAADEKVDLLMRWRLQQFPKVQAGPAADRSNRKEKI